MDEAYEESGVRLDVEGTCYHEPNMIALKSYQLENNSGPTKSGKLLRYI